MKTKSFLIISVLVFGFTTILNSCKKDPPDNSISASKQFSLIEKKIGNFNNYLMDTLKGTSDSLKPDSLQTSASDHDLDSMVTAMITNSTTKLTQAWADEWCGIIRTRGTCGSYRKLDIYQDAEDTHNNSDIGGWTGDSYLEGHGNFQLYFCVVSAPFFERLIGQDFAILKLDDDLPDFVSEYNYLIDNEDDNNLNNQYFNGTQVSNVIPGMGGNSYFDRNTGLDFYYFPRNPNSASLTLPTLPGIGLEYGVFSSNLYHSATGWFYMDDEDGGNINHCTTFMWDDASYTHLNLMDGGKGMPGILELGPYDPTNRANSKWYFARAY